MLAVMSLIAVIGWFALGLQLYIMLVDPALSAVTTVQRIVKFFSFFTILTNLIVCVEPDSLFAAAAIGFGKVFFTPIRKISHRALYCDCRNCL